MRRDGARERMSRKSRRSSNSKSTTTNHQPPTTNNTGREGGDLVVSVDHPNLLPELVDEDDRGLMLPLGTGLGRRQRAGCQRGSQLTQRLGHQPGLRGAGGAERRLAVSEFSRIVAAGKQNSCVWTAWWAAGELAVGGQRAGDRWHTVARARVLMGSGIVASPCRRVLVGGLPAARHDGLPSHPRARPAAHPPRRARSARAASTGQQRP